MNKDRFLNDATIEKLHKILEEPKPVAGLYELRLVGGAVVDTLEGRTPKDYDFVGFSNLIIDRFKENGFKHISTTKTAKTFSDGKITVQFINFTPEQFGFTISQSSYNFKRKELIVDRDSFDNKTLIPVSFEERQNIASALRRIPHYQNKGYSINELTYLSLVNTILRESPSGGS